MTQPVHQVDLGVGDRASLVVEHAAATRDQLDLEAFAVVMAHAVERVLLSAPQLEQGDDVRDANRTRQGQARPCRKSRIETSRKSGRP